MGGLQDDNRWLVPGGNRLFPDALGQCLEIVQILTGQAALVGVRLALGTHGTGFKPDQPRAALGKGVIALLHQFGRRAVCLRIAPLHGLNGDAVGDNVPVYMKLLFENVQIFRQRQIDARRLCGNFHFFQCFCGKHDFHSFTKQHVLCYTIHTSYRV